MRPSVKIDLNQAIANTRFMQDLSTVLYGAEIALKRIDTPEAQIVEVLDEIIQTTFSSIEFDFDSIGSLLNKGTQLVKFESYQSTAVDSTRAYSSRSSAFSAPGSEIEFGFFEENPFKEVDQSLLYKTSEKTYDSHMDDDEDFEQPLRQQSQHSQHSTLTGH